MSGHTQYIIAKREDAEKLAADYDPISHLTGCHGYKYFGADELTLLYSLFKNGEATYKDFDNLACDDGGLIYDIPDEFVQHLAKCKPKELTTLAENWFKLREEKKSPFRMKAEDLEKLLKDISALCKKAVASSTPILLWHMSEGY